jgi:hypothetical protein
MCGSVGVGGTLSIVCVRTVESCIPDGRSIAGQQGGRPLRSLPSVLVVLFVGAVASGVPYGLGYVLDAAHDGAAFVARLASEKLRQQLAAGRESVTPLAPTPGGGSGRR